MEEWKDFFDENGYEFSQSENAISITKKRPNQSIVVYILILIVSPIFIFIGSYKVFLLLVLLACIPFVYTKWKLPYKVAIDFHSQMVIIGNLNYRFYNIECFKINEDVRLSDVSPFKEGCEDYIYEFKLKLKNGRAIQTFELWFRESMMEEMDELVTLLNSCLIRDK